MLRIIDVRWMNHLQEMDYLKTGIGLRASDSAILWSNTREDRMRPSHHDGLYVRFPAHAASSAGSSSVEDEQSPLRTGR